MLSLPANASPQVTKAHLELSEQVERARAVVKAVKDENKDMIGWLAHKGLMLISGVATGYYQGRYGDTIRYGLPTTSWGTILLSGMGAWRFVKSGGKEGRTMLALGVGMGIVSLAGWAARKGMEERAALPAAPGGAQQQPTVAAGAAPVGLRMDAEMLRQYASSFA